MTGLTAGDIAGITHGRLIGGDAAAPVSGAVIDSRKAGPGVMFCALKGERADGHDYIAASLALGSPCALAERVPEGVTGGVIVVPDVAKAMAELAAYCRAQFTGPVVGIVGSSGKTTTKEMVANVMSERFNTLRTEGNLNNELGVPLTLFRLDSDTGAAVVELGISDFGEMTRLGNMAKPDIAVYTLIGRSHLNALHDLDGVMRAKGELLDVMRPDALVIVNGDNAHLAALQCRQRKLTYGLGEHCDVRAENLSASGSEVRFDIVRGGTRFTIKIPAYGRHLVYAALAAATVGFELGLSTGEIAEGLAKYAPVGSRARVIHEHGITVVDDCYNSNPDSCSMAIESASDLPGRLVCVLGDMLNLGPDSAKMHAEVGALAKKHAAVLLCAGDESANMGGVHFDSVEALIDALPDYICPGDTVLCKASRGMHFERVVDALLARQC